MDKTDALNIVQRYAMLLSKKFDFQKIILLARMRKVILARIAILILPSFFRIMITVLIGKLS
jgi:hypothetical protein